jgi:hypothetical protein
MEKIIDWVKKNPVKTALGVAAVAFVATNKTVKQKLGLSGVKTKQKNSLNKIRAKRLQ